MFTDIYSIFTHYYSYLLIITDIYSIFTYQLVNSSYIYPISTQFYSLLLIFADIYSIFNHFYLDLLIFTLILLIITRIYSFLLIFTQFFIIFTHIYSFSLDNIIKHTFPCCIILCSCPATGLQPQQPLSTSFKQLNVGMNNIVKFMLKRGLVNDLARIPHSLDMSSPLMAFTVNAALKPLEALSRIVNLPPVAPIPGRSMAKHKTDAEQQDSSAPRLSASTSDSTRAQVSIHLSIYPFN